MSAIAKHKAKSDGNDTPAEAGGKDSGNSKSESNAEDSAKSRAPGSANPAMTCKTMRTSDPASSRPRTARGRTLSASACPSTRIARTDNARRQPVKAALGGVPLLLHQIADLLQPHVEQITAACSTAAEAAPPRKPLLISGAEVGDSAGFWRR